MLVATVLPLPTPQRARSLAMSNMRRICASMSVQIFAVVGSFLPWRCWMMCEPRLMMEKGFLKSCRIDEIIVPTSESFSLRVTSSM
jgi:hypothetical protein